MPPKKTGAATRSSARQKAAAKPKDTQNASTNSKAKSKRALSEDSADDDGESEDDHSVKKPAAKKKKFNNDNKADVDDDEPAKMVTVIKRGSAPVDPVSGKVASHQVYADNANGEVYDAMLNQTDVSQGANKNKFYVLQLLHPIGDASSSVLFTRWGRVGENGQSQTKGPFSANQAVVEFKKQFKSKTATEWANRVGMTAKKGKYVWLERDYADDEEKEEGSSKSKEPKETEKIPDSTLAKELQAFCRLVFSNSIIDATLSSLNYDARKLPLGKLSKATILSGFTALKELSEVISNPDGDLSKSHGGFAEACATLSSSYYSIIPHDFGRGRPIIISDSTLLKRELELVDALGDMEVASKLISSSVKLDDHGIPLNPIDAQFRSLGLSSMTPLAKDSTEFKVLEAYARDTHAKTHYIKANIQHIFRVERGSETEAWKKAGFDSLSEGERYLLWHGSRTSNFAGILKQGLRIAPPEAPVNGYMFGKGVYFADMMSKSANYCYASLSNGVGILLLCEVAVKPFYERYQAEYNADQGCKNNNKRCTLGLGSTRPLKWKDAGKATGNEELIGCHMPEGGGTDVSDSVNCALLYNEYIVYDVSQIKVKYLLMVGM